MSQKHFTHEVFLTHVVSLDLLDYLCPVHKKEVLRVDAFRDLLNKTCQQPTGAMTKEGNSTGSYPWATGNVGFRTRTSVGLAQG